MATEKKGTKIAERQALNAAGEDQSDYTEAVKARYIYLSSGKTAERDFSHIENAVDRAFAIEGFLNKVGHSTNIRNSNEYKNADKAVVDAAVDEAIDAFMANIAEGGWTNREGGNEVNLGAIQEAFAEFRGTTVEAVKAAWGALSDENKTRIRTNPQIKAIVARKRAEKAAAIAAAAGGQNDDLPSI